MIDDGSVKGTKGLGLIFLGPVFGLLYVCFLPLIALMTLLLAIPEYAGATKAAILENGAVCLGCHETPGMSAAFKNGQTLSVSLKADDFTGTVHGFLNCTDCHGQISLDSHPGGVIESRSAFLLTAVKACRTCHTDDQLTAKPNHAFLVNKTNGPPCTECHGAHGIRRISDLKPTLSDNQYCLTCHTKKISKRLDNGEMVSLSVDPSRLKASVHSTHACSDCHTEFSKTSHPAAVSDSSRTRAVAISQACKRCHADKIKAVKDSIHYNLSFPVGDIVVSQGNMKAPVCTDCHGFHDVSPKAAYDTLSGVPCKKCHAGIFNLYAKSVHGVAKANGEHKAPLCAACHFAHDISTTARAERIRSACLGCHKGIESVHAKWLPNAGLHLSAVACAACHSPGSGKGIYLRLVDENTGQPFSEAQMAALLGTTNDELSHRLSAHGDGIPANELWGILSQLNERGTNAKLTYLGKMDVSNGADSHRLALKKDAVRECEQCHRAGSDFFKSVTVAVVKADGKLAQFKARPEVLGSMYSVLALKQFYVLGSTRLKLLDWIGILMVAGGMMVPAAHISVRILTAPLRVSKKKSEKTEGGAK